MGILSSAFARPTGEKALSLYELLYNSTGWRNSASGKVVNTQTALQVSTVLACTRVIGEGIAQVPLKLMRKKPGSELRETETEHPLYELLSIRPNDWQTSFEYRETVAMHAVLCGNHYSFINRSNRSGIMELIPFEPGSVTVKRGNDWSLSYDVRAANGSVQNFPAKAIWHVKGPSWNSWMGLDAVQLAREAIGLAMATEESQSRLQRNGVRTSGTYSVSGTLGPDQYKALKNWIDENYAGADRDGSAMVLDRDAKWIPHSMTGVDAQTIETRRFQIEEICRHFRVNPIMVGAESKNTTYASAEQMFLAHVVHCLAPWYMRLEQSIDANLLTAEERKAGLYSCFVDEGLLRGSLKDKHEMIRADVNGGILIPNEGRALLDLPPDENPESNKLRIPANIAGAQPVNPPASAKAFEDFRLEVREVLARPVTPPAPQPINVDARTTVNQAPAAPININMPEGMVQLEATINPPEVKAGDVNVSPPQVTVVIDPDKSDTETTFKRDPHTQEIVSSVTKRI